MKLTRTRRTWVVAAAVAAIVTAANASQGGYFSQSWGWIALAFLAPTTIALILDRIEAPGRLRVAFAGLMLAFGVWVALSALWSSGDSAPLREAERMLMYVAIALAIAIVLRRGDSGAVMYGLIAGGAVVCSYSLATRLFPDVLESYDAPTLTYRLSTPVGYWNALGLLAAMVFVAAFGVVAHARRTWIALTVAAAMPILAATLYFTYSRGAWASQVFGFAAMVAFDPRRLRLLWTSAVVAIPPFLAVLYASLHDALTNEGAPKASAASAGHKVAVALFLAMAATAGVAWGARAISRRVTISRRIRRAVDVALAAGVLLLLAGALVEAGGPVQAVETVKARFDAPLPGTGELNSRVLSISGNGRSDQIRIAIDAGREHPLAGVGAGSYEARWYEFRRSGYSIRDAHSLYAETFGELGAVGLATLCLMLLLPAAAAMRARRNRLVPAAMGAYLAWAAHSALDWNWELVGVSMVALLAGGAALLASERSPRSSLRLGWRLGLVPVCIALSLAAVVSLVGNQALSAGSDAIAARRWTAAVGDARKAEALLPWSYEPHIVYGDAAAGLGDRRGAIAGYRRAVELAPDNWEIWLRLAQVSLGRERVQAYRRVHALNPLQSDLPDYVYR